MSFRKDSCNALTPNSCKQELQIDPVDIKNIYEMNVNTNGYTDQEKEAVTKLLNSIDGNAVISDKEVKAAYERNKDSNPLTDREKELLGKYISGGAVPKDTYTGKQIDAKLADKIDAINGKGLSTVDFTTQDKSKLDGIPAGGKQGLQGVKGNVGSVGSVGPAGPKGNQGDRGFPGSNGTDGKDGAVGTTGAKGDPGIQGPTGAQGPQGVKGDKGTNGADSTVVGPKGIQGVQGFRGLQGIQGIKGNDGSDGKDGTGVTIKGSDSKATILGKSGTAGDMWLITDPGAEFGYGLVSDGGGSGIAHWTNVGAIRGPKGLKGDTGARGPTGAASTVVGPTGATGPAGIQGPTGAKGVDGKDSTVVGPKGSQGPAGPQGVQGPKGDPGTGSGSGIDPADQTKLDHITVTKDIDLDNLSGGVGPQGPKGDPGIKGADGTPGVKGDQGIPGTAGAPGAKGDDGAKGPKGDAGKDGTGVAIQGEKDDEAAIKAITGSKAGDMWIAKDTGHGWVSDGATPTVWIDAGTIKGPKGDKGDTGAKGAKGDTGAVSTTPGPQGTPGAKGADSVVPGPKGSDGAKGNPGVAGPKGAKGDKGDPGTPAVADDAMKFNVDTVGDIPNVPYTEGDMGQIRNYNSTGKEAIALYNDNSNWSFFEQTDIGTSADIIAGTSPIKVPSVKAVHEVLLNLDRGNCAVRLATPAVLGTVAHDVWKLVPFDTVTVTTAGDYIAADTATSSITINNNVQQETAFKVDYGVIVEFESSKGIELSLFKNGVAYGSTPIRVVDNGYSFGGGKAHGHFMWTSYLHLKHGDKLELKVKALDSETNGVKDVKIHRVTMSVEEEMFGV